MGADSSLSHYLGWRSLFANAVVQSMQLMTVRRVQTAGLMLLGHSRLLLHPKPAVGRGKMPRVENEVGEVGAESGVLCRCFLLLHNARQGLIRILMPPLPSLSLLISVSSNDLRGPDLYFSYRFLGSRLCRRHH
jgi:hypothetical protein